MTRKHFYFNACIFRHGYVVNITVSIDLSE